MLLLAGAASGETINYGNLILSPSFTATHFPDTWDLTQCDLVLSYRST